MTLSEFKSGFGNNKSVITDENVIGSLCECFFASSIDELFPSGTARRKYLEDFTTARLFSAGCSETPFPDKEMSYKELCESFIKFARQYPKGFSADAINNAADMSFGLAWVIEGMMPAQYEFAQNEKRQGG